MAALVRSLGVVGERHAVLATYLTATSRLCCGRAISLLRRGAAASGKNHLVEAVFKLIPPESIVTAVGGSPKSLAYYGGVDADDALKHKLIYIPEAAAIADKHGVESEFTTMLRVLISECRLVYQTVQTQENGPPITVTVTKDGPIAVVITSARPNIEEEMMTRLMVVDADESSDQTARHYRKHAHRSPGRRRGGRAEQVAGLSALAGTWRPLRCDHSVHLGHPAGA